MYCSELWGGVAGGFFCVEVSQITAFAEERCDECACWELRTIRADTSRACDHANEVSSMVDHATVLRK